MSKIAIVRVRGKINIRKEIKDTLNMLRLYNKNFCTVVEDAPVLVGMIKKVKDFVTFGEINDETFSQLVETRGEQYKGREKDSKGKIEYSRRYFVYNDKKLKKYFRLNPPKKGYGSIKKPFLKGGGLGNRKEKINDLIKRMI